MVYILNHDLLDRSPLFEDGTVPRCTKLDTQLVKELEKHIETNKSDFQPDSSLETDVIFDLLSKIRQYPNLSTVGNFGRAIQVTLSESEKISEIHPIIYQQRS